VLSSHCLESNSTQRSTFCLAGLVYNLLLYIALTLCSPAILVELAYIPAVGAILEESGATAAVFFAAFILWIFWLCSLYFSIWVNHRPLHSLLYVVVSGITLFCICYNGKSLTRQQARDFISESMLINSLA
jgi:hypothetical protein